LPIPGLTDIADQPQPEAVDSGNPARNPSTCWFLSDYLLKNTSFK
jgi:hypothetical protein